MTDPSRYTLPDKCTRCETAERHLRRLIAAIRSRGPAITKMRGNVDELADKAEAWLAAEHGKT